MFSQAQITVSTPSKPPRASVKQGVTFSVRREATGIDDNLKGLEIVFEMIATPHQAAQKVEGKRRSEAERRVELRETTPSKVNRGSIVLQGVTGSCRSEIERPSEKKEEGRRTTKKEGIDGGSSRVELNRIGPTALACSQAVRPRIFVPHTYVAGPLETGAHCWA